MITFEQAKAIVAENRNPNFPPEAGYTVEDFGLENETHYQLFDYYNSKFPGAAAWVRPNDEFYITVNKTTGEYAEQETPLENATPVN